MKKMLSNSLLIAAVLSTAASTFGQEQFIELLRSDLRAEKVAMVTASMELDDAESQTFWPIYREYELELSKLGDRRVALLREYGKSYDSMIDENAKRLVNAWFQLQEDHTKLAKKYYGRFEKALSSTTAARFVQVEHQIQLLVEIGLASELPLVKPAQ